MSGQPMITLEWRGIEVDFCEESRGIWLDAGELELLFGQRRMPLEFLDAAAARATKGEAPRPCPVCGKRMAKKVAGGAKPVLYDACVRGHGLWFDAGELDTVLAYGSEAPGGTELQRWLKEIFRAAPASEGNAREEEN